jgi:hypothetical protein
MNHYVNSQHIPSFVLLIKIRDQTLIHEIWQGASLLINSDLWSVELGRPKNPIRKP